MSNRSFKLSNYKQRIADVDSNFVDRRWEIIEHGIHEIYNHRDREISMEELYKCAYDMVLYKFGERLYNGFVVTVTTHIKVMKKSIKSAKGSFLDELNRKWTDHTRSIQMIGDVLMYLERTYIPSHHKTPIKELRLSLWRDHIIQSKKIQTRLVDTLLEQIHRERMGEVINHRLMMNVTKMLTELGVYQEVFEKSFLDVSANYYSSESQQYIEVYSCSNYLRMAEKRINEEVDRVSHYLDKNTEYKITAVVEEELIETHMHKMVHMERSGLIPMLQDDMHEDLNRMYNLFKRVPGGLNLINDVMASLLKETCMQLVTEPDRLKDMREKYNEIITKSFNNDNAFQNVLKSSFESLAL